MMILYLTILLNLCTCQGYRFLFACPTSVPSENRLVLEIVKGVLEAGHHVTLVPSHEVKLEHENLTKIWVSQIAEAEQRVLMESPEESNPLKWKDNLISILGKYYTIKNRELWKDERIQQLWKHRKMFDLFFTLSWYSEGTFPFLIDNSIPFVQLVTAGSEPMSLTWEGNILSPAVIPSLLVSYNEDMTFWERSLNLIATIQHYYSQKNLISEYTTPLHSHFSDITDYASFYDRVSLTLINGHFALDGVMPLLPSQVEIGTIHIKEAESLEKTDKELAQFVEGSSSAGIVYFSLGTIARSSDIPQDAKEKFLEAFKQIPQRVLWKYEGDDLELPPNVLTRNWMPQQDILGHPKMKVFISHCGNLGTQEAKFHGVPILGVPVAFDQPRNAARMVRKGYAISLDWNSLTSEKIVDALNTLVNDSSYKDRMMAVSRVLKDQMDKPVDRAVWWLEYVVRHKGAPHLHFAGRKLSLFQYVMLDVILFWIALFGIFIFGFVYTVKVIFCGRKNRWNVNIHDGGQKEQQKKKIS